ncbi:MAG: SecDF P1 head subdomain-containing protein [Acidimicrobiales bacterium]
MAGRGRLLRAGAAMVVGTAGGLVTAGPALGATRVVASFPTAGPAIGSAVAADAAVIRKRLHALGVIGDRISIRGQEIDVSGQKRLPVAASELAATGNFYVRPVRCSAPAYVGPSDNGASTVPDDCPAPYQMVPTNPNFQPISPNYNLEPDPELAADSSTPPASDLPGSTVLLESLGVGATRLTQTDDNLRYLLGPATLTGRAIKGAAVTPTPTQGAVLTITSTRSGARTWNLIARRSFHELLGMDLDGVVVTAPIIEPAEATFSPFGSGMQLSGLSRPMIRTVAALLDSGALLAPLVGRQPPPA